MVGRDHYLEVAVKGREVSAMAVRVRTLQHVRTPLPDPRVTLVIAATALAGLAFVAGALAEPRDRLLIWLIGGLAAALGGAWAIPRLLLRLYHDSR